MLRQYQKDAVKAVYDYFCSKKGNPCVVLPTGAGKTHVIVQLCQDMEGWGGRVLVLAHVKELLEQSLSKLEAAGLKCGAYSASLGRREKDAKILVAGIQSVYRKGLELCGDSPFNILIVDEAHRIPQADDGMYRQLISDLTVANPRLRIVGLTATPYRTTTGYVCGEDSILNEICYEADVADLIKEGYLSHLSSKRSLSEVDVSGVKITRGDFNANSMQAAFDDDVKVINAVNEIIETTRDRKKVLIFTCGIQHAANVAAKLEVADQTVRIVTSEHDDRTGAIEAFKAGKCKFLVNVNVLTEGFDAPDIDAVVLLRATTSPGMYYQMVGRGLRIHPDKVDCLILDYGGNIARHGTIDNLQIKERGGKGGGEAPVKCCPECQEMVHAGLRFCPRCGTEFEQNEVNHEEKAATDSPLSIDQQPTRYEVSDTGYSIHRKRGAPDDAPKTMRVTYYEGVDAVCDEWICVEHSGFAFEKARKWWSERSQMPMPRTAEEAVRMANRGALAFTSAIEVKKVKGYNQVCRYELGAKPDKFDDEDSDWICEQIGDIPF